MQRSNRLESIGLAAAGIAHDLNNQLTLILNHLALSDVEGARRALTRCSDLTGHILSFSRGQRLATEPVNLAAFVADHLASLPVNDSVHVEIDAQPTPEIEADSAALRRVLDNLVNNALDAMDGQGKLTVRVRACRIEVEDSGPGIAHQETARIFDAFFSTKGAKGTGLGLAIVRDIMRAHGGGVRVEPGLAGGARFVLEFRDQLR